MKITDAVFFTDNKTVRIETDVGNFYLTDDGKVYDMHPINVMANEMPADKLKKFKADVKKAKFHNDEETKKWL
jgi:hypothetical protein